MKSNSSDKRARRGICRSSGRSNSKRRQARGERWRRREAAASSALGSATSTHPSTLYPYDMMNDS
eukprot:9501513-Pyramimonas_sp.AAC.1